MYVQDGTIPGIIVIRQSGVEKYIKSIPGFAVNSEEFVDSSRNFCVLKSLRERDVVMIVYVTSPLPTLLQARAVRMLLYSWRQWRHGNMLGRSIHRVFGTSSNSSEPAVVAAVVVVVVVVVVVKGVGSKVDAMEVSSLAVN